MNNLESRHSFMLQNIPQDAPESMAFAEESAGLGMMEQAMQMVEILSETPYAAKALFLRAKIMCLQGIPESEVHQALQLAAEKGHPLAKLYLKVMAGDVDLSIELPAMAKDMPDWELGAFCYSFNLVPEVFGELPTQKEVETLQMAAKDEYLQFLHEKQLVTEEERKRAEQEAREQAEREAREKAEHEARLEEERQAKARAENEARMEAERKAAKEKEIAAKKAAIRRRIFASKVYSCVGGFFLLVFLCLGWSQKCEGMATCVAPYILQCLYSLIIVLLFVFGLKGMRNGCMIYGDNPTCNRFVALSVFFLLYVINCSMVFQCLFHQASSGWALFGYGVCICLTGYLGNAIAQSKRIYHKWYMVVVYHLPMFLFLSYILNR